MQAIISYLAANWMGIGLGLLLIDRGLERLFPNASLFKKVDQSLSEMGISEGK